MTNRRTISLVLAAVIMFGGTVALYEWNQAVSAQQAAVNSPVQPLHDDASAKPSN
ncbi:hypothetical protein N0M98_21245 [Paenibacillus doosanensis]|uniref:Uncharacterized protein n=1 Tax=Paenibacillus konkukensis TaxID=2020716 RepID=A0ABY4RJ86_9BACL|nr:MULTISPECIES: hypothetical protein [Paenibacillus]MCS7462652.1 hypothetical protein [Paenibacillus doosanensis]UQZ82527.1 hypothetical protein SK3146_01684 [Paenibacillus konkukensis]